MSITLTITKIVNNMKRMFWKYCLIKEKGTKYHDLIFLNFNMHIHFKMWKTLQNTHSSYFLAMELQMICIFNILLLLFFKFSTIKRHYF